MNTPIETVAPGIPRAEPVTEASRPYMLPDREYWQQYLTPNEHILWADRPDNDFRMGGMSKTYAVTFSIAFLLLLVPLISGYDQPQLVVVAVIVAIGGLLLTFGPGKLDQRNRRHRRYALTHRRALAVRDLRHERPRQLTLHEGTAVLVMEDRDSGEHIVAVINRASDETAGHAVQFERLTAAQVEAVLDALAGQGIEP